MMQSNWLYWEWSLPVWMSTVALDSDNGIEAKCGIWYLRARVRVRFSS